MKKNLSGIVSFTISPQPQSGIVILASTLVRYHWSRIIPVVPSYATLHVSFQGFAVALSYGSYDWQYHT
jgi:hypothetical protein